MKTLIFTIFVAALLSGFCFQNELPKHPGLICTLSTPQTIYKSGEVPKFEVRIKNVTNKEIYLIGSLDGSDIKRRMPYCYFSIDKPKPDTIIFSSCGFANPLRLKDFKMVQPHQDFNPYDSVDNFGFFSDYSIAQKETFRNPGIYKIQFHYVTNSGDIHKFVGSESLDRIADSAQLKSFFEKIPKVDLVSNLIEIQIEK